MAKDTLRTSSCGCKLSRSNFKQVLHITHIIHNSQSPSEYADMQNHHENSLPPDCCEYGKSSLNLYPYFNPQINIMFQCHIFETFNYTSTFKSFLNVHLFVSLPLQKKKKIKIPFNFFLLFQCIKKYISTSSFKS